MNIHSLPCQHTSSHLFNHPLCDDQSLIKRIANVVFHILTFGIPLAVYKIYTCLFPRTASGQAGQNDALQNIALNTVQDPSNWSIAEKKQIIANLPLWFAGHFPESQRQELLNIYADLVIDTEGRSDDEVNDMFVNQQNLIDGYFANGMSKTGLSLRGLTIPKNDSKLAHVVEQTLHKAWRSVLLGDEAHYAECNNGIMTYDSRAILVAELHNNVEQMTEEKRALWSNEARNCTLYNELRLGTLGPVFTITVGIKS